MASVMLERAIADFGTCSPSIDPWQEEIAAFNTSRLCPEKLAWAALKNDDNEAVQRMVWMLTSQAIAVQELNFERIRERLLICRVEMPKPSEVREYCLARPRFTEALPEIASIVRGLFVDAELSLEVYNDPEVAETYLVMFVRKEQYESDMLDRLEKASEAFSPQPADHLESGYILLTTDFSRPRGLYGISMGGCSKGGPITM